MGTIDGRPDLDVGVGADELTVLGNSPPMLSCEASNSNQLFDSAPDLAYQVI